MTKSLFKLFLFTFIGINTLTFIACDDDDDEKMPPPVAAKYRVDTVDTYHIKFSCTSESSVNLSFLWNYGNGQISRLKSDTAVYYWPGEYSMSLRVFSNGSNTYVQDYTYVIDTGNYNPELFFNPYFNNLATRNNSSGDKTWVLSNVKGFMSTGPSQSLDAGTGFDYENDPIVEDRIYPANYFVDSLDCADAHLNEMTFFIKDYEFNNANDSSWIVNWTFANSEFGYSQNTDQDICLDITHGLDSSGYYDIQEKENGTVFIKLSGENFLLYYDGKPSKTKCQVLALTKDLLVVRKSRFDANGEPIGYRMLRFVPKGKENDSIPTVEIKPINPPTE